MTKMSGQKFKYHYEPKELLTWNRKHFSWFSFLRLGINEQLDDNFSTVFRNGIT